MAAEGKRAFTRVSGVFWRLVLLVAVPAVLGVSLLVAAQAESETPTVDDSLAELFTPVAEVLEHPRCMNCHPRTDRPRQGDNRHLHRQNVSRGPEGMGMPGMQCSTCHTAQNNVAADVPGAPNWHLAPIGMGWQGLSRGDLCRTLVDTARNGNRSLADLVHHMETDPLVLWGWSPGEGRSAVPSPHADFVDKLKIWAEAGGPCPV